MYYPNFKRIIRHHLAVRGFGAVVFIAAAVYASLNYGQQKASPSSPPRNDIAGPATYEYVDRKSDGSAVLKYAVTGYSASATIADVIPGSILEGSQQADAQCIAGAAVASPSGQTYAVPVFCRPGSAGPHLQILPVSGTARTPATDLTVPVGWLDEDNLIAHAPVGRLGILHLPDLTERTIAPLVSDAALAPDRAFLAYDVPGALKLYEFRSGRSRQLLQTQDYGYQYLTWSPDNQWVAFAHTTTSGGVSRVSAINVETQVLKTSTTESAYRSLAWADVNSTVVAGGRDSDGTSRVHMLDLDANNSTEVFEAAIRSELVTRLDCLPRRASCLVSVSDLDSQEGQIWAVDFEQHRGELLRRTFSLYPHARYINDF